MIANKGTYILSPIDHKSTYKVDGTDIELLIPKQYENNLRERNPQLGTVEGLPEDNWLGLQVGDTVAVNHFTFFGDIGPDKSFKIKPHATLDGKMYFPANERQLYFKYNNKTPEVFDGYMLCNGVETIDELCFEQNQGRFFHKQHFGQRGMVTHGKLVGSEVLVLKSSFYLITLDKVDYFKIRESEVVATVVDGEAIPYGNCFAVEYMPGDTHAFFDLSMVKGANNVTAVAEDGTLLQVFRNNGVQHGNKWLIDGEMVVWKWRDGMRERKDLPLGERIEL